MQDELSEYEDVQRLKYELWAEEPAVSMLKAAPERRIVAEGDSWFD